MDLILSLFNSNESGNSIKLKSAGSFIEWANGFHLLYGNGLASYFYSSGRGYAVAQTEITVLDNIRYFGIFGALALYFYIFFPKKGIKFKEFYIPFIIMLLYTLMSITNPVLFNSYGSLVVLWYWSSIINNKEYKFEN